MGIGDINSSFLPKIEPLTHPIPPSPTPAAMNEAIPSTVTDLDQTSTESSNPSLTIPEPTPPPDESEGADLTTKTMLQQNSLALEAQLEERPLAKKQEALSEGEPPRERHHHTNKHEPVYDDSVKAQDRSMTPKPEKHPRKALLKNDDFELQRVAKVRTETFYTM